MNILTLSSHGIELMETAIKNNTDPNKIKVNMYKQFLKRYRYCYLVYKRPDLKIYMHLKIGMRY